ncbi:uncharacterized protein LOC114298150 [Camellia sinensis]|uniref:uncharacterized protein LOC114298150 n=1 Tax=Camellia sinensis TaxID=4442 RepID=UPI001035B684|nr:uncharacterized protein LOC114298150 [Camellia sinensis]
MENHTQANNDTGTNDNTNHNDDVNINRNGTTGINNHIPTPTANLPGNIENQILEELERLKSTRQNERTHLFSEFRKQRPPIFTGEPDPKIAENWIRQIEKMLETMGIVKHTDKIALAVYQLEGETDHWWTLINESRDITTMTWVQFKESFLRKYFPHIVRQERIREFQLLEQDTMTVTQYVAKFEELARYATRYVADDKEKARKFEWGLDPIIRGRVLPLQLPTFADVMDTALDAEQEMVDTRQIWSLKKESQFDVGPKRNSRRHAVQKPYSRAPPQQQQLQQQLQQQYQKESFQTRSAWPI